MICGPIFDPLKTGPNCYELTAKRGQFKLLKLRIDVMMVSFVLSKKKYCLIQSIS